MVLTFLRKLLVLLTVILTFTGGNPMATPENEKKLYSDLAEAYGKSRTSRNKAISKAYRAASDSIETPTTPPPIDPPPIDPPPVEGNWPTDLEGDPTGPKKPLPGYSGTVTTSQDGQVIDGLDANIVNVNHSNVTIRNFKVEAIKKQPGKTGLVLEDGIIDGQDKTENAVEWSDYVCRRVEVTRTVDAYKAHGNVLIDNCYIHDLTFRTGEGTGAGNYTHNDGVQVSSGNNISITNSRFENTRGNAGVFVDSDQGVISNATIDNNYFTNVGNYMIYVKGSANPEAQKFGLPDKIIIKNNVFGKRPDYLDPSWGLMAAEIHATNLVWENNVQESSGKQLVLDSWGKANPA